MANGSHLFVPDNPKYEGSVLLWFDEHDHPVKLDELTPARRTRAHRERCYKLVSPLHLRREHYVYAAPAVVPGNAHELPALHKLVDDFVAAVGPGVMERLILDRGLVDGALGLIRLAAKAVRSSVFDGSRAVGSVVSAHRESREDGFASD